MKELLISWAKSATIRRIVYTAVIYLAGHYGITVDDATLQTLVEKSSEIISLVTLTLAARARMQAEGPLPMTPAQARAQAPPLTP